MVPVPEVVLALEEDSPEVGVEASTASTPEIQMISSSRCALSILSPR